MTLYHDSRNGAYRYPAGAVSCGVSVRLTVQATSTADVKLRVWWDGKEYLYDMEDNGKGFFQIVIKMPKTPGLFWYYFRATDADGTVWNYGNAPDKKGGVGNLYKEEPPSYQITVYDAGFKTPEWLRNGVMMQIMVDRFHASQAPDPSRLPLGCYYHAKWSDEPVLVINDRSGDYTNNDFFGGDLKGLTQKLDYIAEMGVTVLYLNPIFSARSNHKYNTSDYMTIDPAFGTEEDFRELCDEARKRGIRVMLDGVFSHTGSDSLYFNRNGTYGTGGAYNDRKSPYYSWYTFKKWPDDYNSWWGITTLPTIDKSSRAYRDFIIGNDNSVSAHWLRAGASGWRLDVADELPMDFLRELRRRVKQVDPDSALLGEVWEDPSNKVAYGEMRCYCLGDTVDCTMNYPLRDAVLGFLRGRIGAQAFVREMESMKENQPAEFMYSQMNLLGSHDKARALTILADVGDMEPDRRFRHSFDLTDEAYKRGKRRLIAAWNLMCALPGIPCIYYGDEAGLYGMTDPFCRGTFPWGHEDKELQKAFMKASQMRMKSDVLRTGTLRVYANGEDVLLIEREIGANGDVFGEKKKKARKVLAVNRAAETQWVEACGKIAEIPAETAMWIK